MAEITTKRGVLILVDDENYEWLSRYSWALSRGGRNLLYAHSKIHDKHVKMHRLIMRAETGQKIDHINGNTLDNRQLNLRVASSSENGINSRKSISNTSGFKGVCFINKRKHLRLPWKASITIDRRLIPLGYFATAEEAALAYDRAALQYRKQFARLNFGT